MGKCVKICCLAFLVPIIAFVVAYLRAFGTVEIGYRFMTSVRAFKAILALEPEQTQNFLEAYSLFDLEIVTPEQEKKIEDYYSVLNHLCALGDVEKMYIPPIYDENQGVYANQLIFEEDVAVTIDAKPGKSILELGCGRGRIANHIARYSGAKVTGFNIDAVQVQKANEFAEETKMTEQLEFHKGSFNVHPLPFKDA